MKKKELWYGLQVESDWSPVLEKRTTEELQESLESTRSESEIRRSRSITWNQVGRRERSCKEEE